MQDCLLTLFSKSKKHDKEKSQTGKRIDIDDDLRGRKVFGKIQNDGSVEVKKSVQPQHRRTNWAPQIQVAINLGIQESRIKYFV